MIFWGASPQTRRLKSHSCMLWYASYHEPSSCEFIELNKQAVNIKPDETFELVPQSAEPFRLALQKLSKQFAYSGLLKRVPTTRTVTPNAADATINDIVFSDHKNILETWNEISEETIQNWATETWGDKSWTETTPKDITSLSTARG